MNFIRIELQRLRNEEWFQLFTEFRDLVQQKTAEILDIAVLFITFIMLYGNADEALELVRKSSETGPMRDADKKRDATYSGISHAIKSAKMHYEAAKREAAREIEIAMSHYGNVSKKSADEETAAINNFIQDMRGKYSTQVAILELNGWIDELESNNNEYEALVKARSADIASRTKYRMLEVRKETDAVYYEMIKRMEAKMIIAPNDELASFIDAFNVFLKERKDIDAQRKGQRSKAKNIEK
ncbi:MAG: DUF6261 family protein [Prevotellaceae bacterium]|jgi:hypothetical protein|nr:DUF6261 family protein [Prevotellaceae bacterium]